MQIATNRIGAKAINGMIAKISVFLLVAFFGVLTFNFIAPVNALADPVEEVEIDRSTFFNWGIPEGATGTRAIVAVLVTIFNYAAIGVTIAVVGGVIYGAILYTSSGAKSDQAKKGMGVIRNAIIALLLYFIMFAFLNFLVPGGLFT